MENNNSPKTEKKKKSLDDVMENKKFVFVLSLIIAFIVWVAVAMYASPEESYTIYSVPITVDTNNSIVSQKGYVNFWQSDKAIDVTVTGPRYLITSLTADDIVVSANLNTVDKAGISDLTLKVSLKENSQDITISSMSKTSIEVYFDAELEKEFNITNDETVIPQHIAEGYEYNSSELTVTTVKLMGPETEINKVVRVIADANFGDELLYKTSTLPVTLSLEGATAADTVSVNEYISAVAGQEYFLKIAVDRVDELTSKVEFTGTKTGNVQSTVSPEKIKVKVDTESEFTSSELTVLTADYSSLQSGANTYTVNVADLKLPTGVTITDDVKQISITVTLTE